MVKIAKVVLTALLVSGLTPASLSAQQAAPEKLGPFTLTHSCPTTEVVSQGRTGTCWSFATVSFFETESARATGELVDLSEIYPVRKCYLDKMQRYVATKGKNTLGEGGLSHDLIAVINEYGLVPQSAYTGLLPGMRGHSHGEMFRVMKATADAFAKGGRKPSKTWNDALSGIMDAYIGEAPKVVTVDGKDYTPQAYTKDVLKLEAKKFIEVMSYGYTDFDKPGKLTVADNWMHFDQYRNVRIDDFMRGLDHALENGYSIALDCDVSEAGFQARKGIAVMPDEMEKPGAITQELRDEMFADKKTTDDHLMHIVGKAKHEDGRTFYYTKNSWGPVGPYKGYVFMSENYIRAKGLAYMVNEDALPTAGN